MIAAVAAGQALHERFLGKPAITKRHKKTGRSWFGSLPGKKKKTSTIL
jgi:hypothetical protein